VFFAARFTFYSGISFMLEDVPWSLILQSFYRSLRLDLSMIGYLMLFPVLLYFFYLILKKKWVLVFADWINYVLILLFSVTAIGEMCLYREWKAKLSMQALEHFTNPSEVFKSASPGLTAVFFLLSFLFCGLFIVLYNRKISMRRKHPIAPDAGGRFHWKTASLLVGGILFCGISIRGGFQQIPIQSSDAFFCIEPVVNDAAVNPLWNIAYNIIDYENHFKNNPYKDFQQDEADAITRELFSGESDSTSIFLTNARPNIVFILLESWSAHTVKSFGGDDFAPFADSLSRQGIRFSRFYPGGYVSDQGIPAVLSSFPSTSRISVINQSSKSAKLPCINRDLEKYGYESGFIFGGDLNYGNIRSYIYNQKFKVVKEEKDFSSALIRGKLGIQDEDMAREYLSSLNAAKAPFVYAWFTLSSHMPYDFPGKKKSLVPVENEYANSIGYADNALRIFFEGAKKEAWYRNTLFVLVADHSHGSHRQTSVYDPEYHRIPFFMFGEVIDSTFRGKNVEDVFSHTDIVPSLLKQMKLKEERAQYIWGKDMFAGGVRKFAYFCNFSGAGMVGNDGFIGYQHDLKELLFNSFGEGNPKADSLTRLSKAFQQSVYEDYRKK
jgi:phosphoglycerol transferase MdoB-like AlkP superfamily enzyme